MISTLHYTTGYPVIIGLQHLGSLTKLKVADPTDVKEIVDSEGNFIKNFGITHGHHHYIIATRPRCMFAKDSFYWNRELGVGYGQLEFEIGYKRYAAIPFQLFLNGTSPYPFPAYGIGISSFRDIDEVVVEASPDGYPNRLVLSGKSGSRYGYFLEPDLLHFIKFDTENFSIPPFHIEYVGISTGDAGDRDFANRLPNHEKIVKISAEIQRNNPNRQVYIFGYKAQYAVECTPGKFILNSRILEAEFEPKHAAEILEAALIKILQPIQNTEWKGFLAQGSHRPVWMNKLCEILSPSYARTKPRLSVTLFSDCSYNIDGQWDFGSFGAPGIATPNRVVRAAFDLPQ